MTGRPEREIAALRAQLQGERGPRLWRSLEEIAESPAFARVLGAEFGGFALPEAGRRDVLRAMAASILLAGLPGCGKGPPDAVLPRVADPADDPPPDRPRQYATAVTFEGFARPVLATTYAGRPVKLEGNPDHPASRGATDAFTQAAVLELYDPDRSQSPTLLGKESGWDQAVQAMVTARRDWLRNGGEGVRLLVEPTTSPTFRRQIEALRQQLPQLRLHAFEPVGKERREAAARLAFGRPLALRYALEHAAVVVSLEDDLLGPGPAQVDHALGWSARRRGGHDAGAEAIRLHVAESTPTLTGAMADTRRIVPSARIPALVAVLAAALGRDGAPAAPELSADERGFVSSWASELRAHRGEALLAVGAHQPPEVQALALRVNAQLGQLGRTLLASEPVVWPGAEAAGTLQELVADMAAGRVQALVVLGANPAYTAPGDLDFTAALQKVPWRLHAGLHRDETAGFCHWHLPLAHPLESWSDARTVDGTATILQPTVRPLFGGRSVHEVVALLAGDPWARDREIVRATWRDRLDDDAWRAALRQGFVPGTAAAPVGDLAPSPAPIGLPPAGGDRGLEVVIRPDPSIWDGRFANCAWLQELPKPLTKLTWDNVLLVSPALAAERGLATGDVARITLGDRELRGPVWVQPGQAAHTVTAHLGYGRKRIGRVGQGIGYDAYAFRASTKPWLGTGAEIAATGDRHELATTQPHHRMDEYRPVRLVAPGKALEARPEEENQASLYPDWDYPEIAWAMVIDLDLCIGCNACVLACQAENNVPSVGKHEIGMGREMHWLRVDAYHDGDPLDPSFYFQPVPCMHCEKAPCEVGCPVNAAVHTPDGLNAQVYNRCVGTRTCSSYCPYKVRRFNWFEYAKPAEPIVAAHYNPEVTVRARGVMEKCTYCIQRIARARIDAALEDRPLKGSDVITACAAVCPTTAIRFGDRNDGASEVARAQKSPRHYGLLEELGVRPRTTYLARIADQGEKGEG
ncbi:TAT-variant-translocated molybdopterin oxidoreductase [Benzoatithermus flavus]|uniref:TAT-variant-translocated molybdopterin oxidoreductase n=1 Tax=Benzoatithermus flavus TaxID=3108223 RepID=A0ABU8XSC8_9PROT